MTQNAVAAAVPNAVHRPVGRAAALRAAIAVLATWPVATMLFSVWITAVFLIPVAIFVPLVLPCTRAVRRYADVHRRWASGVLGEPIPYPHRPEATGSAFARAWSVLRDPASWREWWWLLVHSTASVAIAGLSASLYLGGFFYLIYPFLYWVTPEGVNARIMRAMLGPATHGRQA